MKKNEAIFAVYYDLNGDVCDVELTERGKKKGCAIKAQGADLTPQKIVEIIKGHNKVEVKSHPLLKLSGSPDCIIYLNNWPICICCG